MYFQALQIENAGVAEAIKEDIASLKKLTEQQIKEATRIAGVIFVFTYLASNFVMGLGEEVKIANQRFTDERQERRKLVRTNIALKGKTSAKCSFIFMSVKETFVFFRELDLSRCLVVFQIQKRNNASILPQKTV